MTTSVFLGVRIEWTTNRGTKQANPAAARDLAKKCGGVMEVSPIQWRNMTRGTDHRLRGR
ncbi:MAG: hypothetical protein WCI87_10020 [Euryarchaeota archaeon]